MRGSGLPSRFCQDPALCSQHPTEGATRTSQMDQVDHNWAICGSNVQRFGTAMRLPLTLRMAAAAVPERYGNPLRLDQSFADYRYPRVRTSSSGARAGGTAVTN